MICGDCPKLGDTYAGPRRARCCIEEREGTLGGKRAEAVIIDEPAHAEEVMRAKRAVQASDGQTNRKARRKAEALERKRRG